MELFLAITLILLISAALARDAPWLPTFQTDVERFITSANIQKGQVMYDLGCGDGRLVEAAAKKGADARGIELSIVPFLFAIVRKLRSKLRRSISIRLADIWKTDVSDADIVYIWLTPKPMPRMKEKLERELRSGTKVLTYIWPMPGWEPIRIDKAEKRGDIYVYELP